MSYHVIPPVTMLGSERQPGPKEIMLVMIIVLVIILITIMINSII